MKTLDLVLENLLSAPHCGLCKITIVRFHEQFLQRETLSNQLVIYLLLLNLLLFLEFIHMAYSKEYLTTILNLKELCHCYVTLLYEEQSGISVRLVQRVTFFKKAIKHFLPLEEIINLIQGKILVPRRNNKKDKLSKFSLSPHLSSFPYFCLFTHQVFSPTLTLRGKVKGLFLHENTQRGRQLVALGKI